MSTALPLTRRVPAWRLAAAMLTLSVLLGGLGYLGAWTWQRLFPAPLFEASAPPHCGLERGPCQALFASGAAIRLAITPRPLTANRPLRLSVDVTGLEAAALAVEFSGIDMNMGLVRADLQQTGDGRFSGEALLPVCVRSRMAWRALVLAQGPGGEHRAAFRLVLNR